ncbi:uncharacterized protein LOC17877834 isoform X2 [Capsella rubella]|uniref:uncharacterized protein LOC17877834 isoform X2 n=1 Tax=Capsella rubella TaxID=81985 RepID=UPI000CD55D52|nr:uncharacterized protein LOC17877834 isoform X2 [Capsella rubella]
MCDRDQPQAFSVETMFDTNFTEVDMEEFRRQTTEPICNTEDDLIQCLPPLVFHKSGKTCVFWDVEDYPIPDGLDAASIYQSIKAAVKNYGCDEEVFIQAYVGNNTISDEFRRQSSDAGVRFEVFEKSGDQYGRHCSIYGDVMLWTLENPTPSNVIIVAKIIDYDFGFAFRCLSDSWSYGVLLSQEPNPIWRFPVGSAPTFLASIFDRSSPRLPTLAISLPNVSGSG